MAILSRGREGLISVQGAAPASVPHRNVADKLEGVQGDQERGGLQNVLHSKTQSFMCKVSTVFLYFFLFPLCLELCSDLTRTEGSTVTFLGRRSDCVITGFLSLCKSPWGKSGKGKVILSSETNVCISFC